MFIGIYSGEPEWLPVEVGESLTVEGVTLDHRRMHASGFIHQAGSEQIFAIPGARPRVFLCTRGPLRGGAGNWPE